MTWAFPFPYVVQDPHQIRVEPQFDESAQTQDSGKLPSLSLEEYFQSQVTIEQTIAPLRDEAACLGPEIGIALNAATIISLTA